MSYCRCGDDSDIYLYADVEGGWTLMGGLGMITRFPDLGLILIHMHGLRALGLKIPQGAIDRLEEEYTEENGKPLGYDYSTGLTREGTPWGA